jgi:hypothetical protein
MNLEACHPALRIFNVDLAKSFYLQWLGFHLDWEYRPEDGGPSVMEVSRDKAVLHLTEHYGDGSPGAKVFIGIDDLEAFHQEIIERPNLYSRPGVEMAEWCEKFMTVGDPFSNRLVFVQTASTRSGKSPVESR